MPGTHRLEVVLAKGGAVDELRYDDMGGFENAAPAAVDDLLELDEDSSASIAVLSNDSDPDGDPLVVTGAQSPDGTVTVDEAGVLSFTPAPDFNGETTITYQISDPEGATAEGQVAVLVHPVNDAPSVQADQASTSMDTPLTAVPVLANDSDPEGDPLRLVGAFSTAGAVTINPDNTLDFMPDPGFTGEAEITYQVSDRPEGDPEAQLAEGVLTVTVGAVAPRDGVVDGTEGDDLIDPLYAGDPDGDLVDGGDAILPGAGPEDDHISAGEGADTIFGGAGDDLIDAGGGDDTVFDRSGRETVLAGLGDDLIDTSGGTPAPDDGYPFDPDDDLGQEADLDPDDDRDEVMGGAGDDTIRTGDDSDTISGGDGADLIDGGLDEDVITGYAGADMILGGHGADQIFGGDGDDTIFGGQDGAGGTNPYALADEDGDRAPGNDRDTLAGGAGNDVIFGGDDADLLLGGVGDDLLDGGLDDDLLSGGLDNDTLRGGHGADWLLGNAGFDLMEGGAGDDLLDGGGEDDTLDGGAGDDMLRGAQGDDLLRGGAGADMMSGGAGRDVFADLTAGDLIDGGSGAEDFDTLDLRGSAPDGGRFEIDYLSDDRESGIVRFFDADDRAAGSLIFSEIENVVPCFTPGTRIATPRGEVLVQNLTVGDRVITRDNGIQPIRWIGRRALSRAELADHPELWPVLVQAGALGKGLPERDLLVSPNHRLLICSDESALYFEDREVLVAAKHLTRHRGIDRVEVSHTTYIHLMFDHHEVILSDGAWSESFQPGEMSLAGVGQDQRAEIFALFPELEQAEGIASYGAARRALKRHEAQLLG